MVSGHVTLTNDNEKRNLMFKIISFVFVSAVGAGSLYIMDQYNPSWKICKVYDEESSGIFSDEHRYTISLASMLKNDDSVGIADKMSDRFDSFKTGCDYVYNEGWLYYVAWTIENFTKE